MMQKGEGGKKKCARRKMRGIRGEKFLIVHTVK